MWVPFFHLTITWITKPNPTQLNQPSHLKGAQGYALLTVFISGRLWSFLLGPLSLRRVNVTRWTVHGDQKGTYIRTLTNGYPKISAWKRWLWLKIWTSLVSMFDFWGVGCWSSVYFLRSEVRSWSPAQEVWQISVKSPWKTLNTLFLNYFLVVKLRSSTILVSGVAGSIIVKILVRSVLGKEASHSLTHPVIGEKRPSTFLNHRKLCLPVNIGMDPHLSHIGPW